MAKFGAAYVGNKIALGQTNCCISLTLKEPLNRFTLICAYAVKRGWLLTF